METDSLPAREPVAETQSLNARLITAGVKRAYAGHLATGRRKPSLDLALDLERKLGIPPAAWREGVDAVKAALDVAATAAGSAQ